MTGASIYPVSLKTIHKNFLDSLGQTFSCDFHLGFHPLSPPDFEWCFGLRHTSHPSDGRAFQLPPIGNTEPFNSWNSCAGTKRHRHPHRSLLGSGLTKREVYYPCATTHVLMRTTDLQGYSSGEYPSINGSPFCWCFPIKKKKAKQKSKKAKQTFKTRHWKRMIPHLSSSPTQFAVVFNTAKQNGFQMQKKHGVWGITTHGKVPWRKSWLPSASSLWRPAQCMWW